MHLLNFVHLEIRNMDDEEMDDNTFYSLVLGAVSKVVSYHNNFLVKEPCRDSPHTGVKFMMEILRGNGTRCHEMFRMEKHVFMKLCDRLKGLGLRATRGVMLEEAVGMFLMTLGHGIGNRMIQERFQHSGETVSRQFANVLHYVSCLSNEVIKPIDNYDEVPSHIRRNPKYWPYFRVTFAHILIMNLCFYLPIYIICPFLLLVGLHWRNRWDSCSSKTSSGGASPLHW